jgi:two-component system, OmpR family, phosphate regulon sensor histidine kinase PhoR
VTLVNPAFRGLFGKEGVEGKQLLEISRHPGLYDGYREVAASKGERLQEIALPGGKTILVHWVPLLEQERISGIVAVFHDISEIRNLERIRRDFVANVSHELRTPVTVIKGYAETLLSGALADDPERGERFLKVIHSHSERLSTLIGDLLTLSELESGEIAFQPESVSLEGAVRRTFHLLEQKAEEKGVVMEGVGLKELGSVHADRGRLEQVLINLLDNAVKYSRAGGKVTVAGVLEGELVRVQVEDTGIGIPETELPRLFERFYRVDRARSRDQGGTGLGLSIVKHIVQAQGGSVLVKSTQGVGTVFSFTVKRVVEATSGGVDE